MVSISPLERNRFRCRRCAPRIRTAAEYGPNTSHSARHPTREPKGVKGRQPYAAETGPSLEWDPHTEST
jgi:hypothetical protein